MLDIDDLTVGYGDQPVLRQVAIRVAAGSITCVLGTNGTGKTTLLKAVSGILAPRSGDIRLDGRSLSGKPPYAIAGLGIAHVPEGRRVFKDLTVRDNLLAAGLVSAHRRERAGRLADVFQLFPRLREREAQVAGTLSGGEQQMLALGRALMMKPRLILLDEPSLGLAPKVVEEVFEHVRFIRGQGITVVLVEQNANIALEVADFGYVLNNGTVALAGTAASLRENDYVRRVYLGLVAATS
jgi:branched-chain amino acid transport system ATP-binding protein